MCFFFLKYTGLSEKNQLRWKQKFYRLDEVNGADVNDDWKTSVPAIERKTRDVLMMLHIHRFIFIFLLKSSTYQS